LLNNAAKYTKEGGQIWLTARRERSSVVISVRDTGEGIPPELIPRLFEMFSQIDRTLGRSQGGLGIGLSLVRTLVEAHGGSVEAKSDGDGQGSEFTVRLPLMQRPFSANNVHEQNNTTERFDGCRVLVVDDNCDAAESLTMLLRLYGAEVRDVNDGESALQTLSSFHPSVIFLDIGMPGMDGFEVASEIRKRTDGQDVTIVALTGWGQDEDRQRTRDSGFDHHLVKPAELSDLQAIMASVPHS
jgi:CheY-like chemotaxis protein